MTNYDPRVISEAIAIWLGWHLISWPQRSSKRLAQTYGETAVPELLPILKGLKKEFDSADVSAVLSSLSDMGDAAAAQFRPKHPEITEDAIQALRWAFTFDNR